MRSRFRTAAGGVARVLVFVVLGVLVTPAGVSAASATVVRLATLTLSSNDAAFSALDSSSNTVVAAGLVTDVYTEPVGGWVNVPAAAVLNDPTASGQSGGGVSISGQTIVEGVVDAATLFEDVFVSPPEGWSGTISPTAKLVASNGDGLMSGVISGETVAALSVQLPGGICSPRIVDSVDVFTEPPAGWSGTLSPVAHLLAPISQGHASVAISGNTIFVGSGSSVYVFVEPAAGWSGTVSPSARLTGAGDLIDISGSTVLADGAVFTEPSTGWSGTIKPAAKLYSTSIGSPEAQALSGSTAALGSVLFPHYGCSMAACSVEVSVFSRPGGGWAGTEVSQPVISTVSGGTLTQSLQGPDLFITGGGAVEVYQVTGQYGARAHRPTVSNIVLSGLRSGRPRLRLTFTPAVDNPPIHTLTLRLPGGLAFTRNRARLTEAVSVAHAKPTIAAHAGVLKISQPARRAQSVEDRHPAPGTDGVPAAQIVDPTPRRTAQTDQSHHQDPDRTDRRNHIGPAR